ncbi:unnamed protein product [Phytophthora fragariaefolia]|uniref:Unnamed protein product n=1 Tax=Phytophthora fragariaefolia TaxID=1490495 RepID=A0A9W7DEQ1_9STRA|nr:unnamed protein product [Phytophthora fragariaefolia]
MQAEPDRARTGSDDGVESTAAALARGDGNPGVATAANTEGDEASELLTLLHGVVGRLDKLEETQIKLKQCLEPPKKDVNPLMDTILSASALGRGSRMHIEFLWHAAHVDPSQTISSPVVLRATPCGRRAPRARLRHEEAANDLTPEHAAQAGQGARGAGASTWSARSSATSRPYAVPVYQDWAFRYPDARQKKLMYVGLDSGFLNWGKNFERQVALGQSAYGFLWSEDVNVDLLGHYLSGTTERYYNKQMGTWWNQLPTLQYGMEWVLDTFKTNIKPAQAMKLFTHHAIMARTLYVPRDHLRGHGEQRRLLGAEHHRSHAEELAHFAQSWETESTKQKSLGRETDNAVRESSNQRKETRGCYEWGREGHLRAACPDLKQRRQLTLAVGEKSGKYDGIWIQDSGFSHHLKNDDSFLENVEDCNDECVQPNDEPLNITKRGNVMLRGTACGEEQMVELARILRAMDVVHNLISNGDVGRVTFDNEMRRNVLVVRAAVGPRHELPSDVVMAALSQELADSVEVSGDVQNDTLLDFHKRLAHLIYDSETGSRSPL